MFEKPQYLTPDGYRRVSKNPFAKKTAGGSNGAAADFKQSLLAREARQNTRRGISKEAAQLIAQALKTMLKQK